MAQLAGWVKGLTASGAATLLTFTHSLERLAHSQLLLAAVLLVLLFDRPAQRLNLVLRDRRLPPKRRRFRRSASEPAGPAAEPASRTPPDNPAPARPNEDGPPAANPSPDQLAAYADLLRQHGQPELANQIERALGEDRTAADDPSADIRRSEPGPPR
jgi:hypothetical protein